MRSSEIYYDLTQNNCNNLTVWGSSGYYTTLRWIVDNGKEHLFFKERHWDRLKAICRFKNGGSLDLTFLEKMISQQITVFREQFPECFGGLARISVLPDGYHFFVYESTVPEQPLGGLVIYKQRSKPEYKLLNDMELYNKLRELDRSKQELVLLGENGDILEGATSNILVHSKQGVHIVVDNALHGITQSLLYPAICEFGEEVIEMPYNINQIADAIEIISIGSGKEVSRIQSINGLHWSDNSDNELYLYLNKFYNKLKENDMEKA